MATQTKTEHAGSTTGASTQNKTTSSGNASGGNATGANETTKALAEKRALQDETTKKILHQVETFQASGELQIPKDYSVANALKSAWLVLLETKTKKPEEHPVLEYCTRESICNCLLKMVVWGLSPIKQQCAFIAFGKTLKCIPEYTGNIVMAKRYGNLKDIKAQVVYKGEEFITRVDPMTGRKQLVKHECSNDAMTSGEITYSYAFIIYKDGSTELEVMSMDMIRQSWAMGNTKGNSDAHKNFADQMCKKTVYSRGAKMILRTSSDAILMYTDEDQAADPDQALAAAEDTRKLNAGQKKMQFNDEYIDPIEETNDAQQPQGEGFTPPVNKTSPEPVASGQRNGSSTLFADNTQAGEAKPPF